MKKTGGSARSLFIADLETDLFVSFCFIFVLILGKIITPKHIFEWQNTKQKHKKNYSY